MCIQGIICNDCGKGVTKGSLYQCTGLYEPSLLEQIVFDEVGCGCGADDHPWVLLRDHHHAYCPSCFVPLGDPDAVIKETDEPKIVAPVKPITATEVRVLQRERYLNV